MFQNTSKTLGFKEILVIEIPPWGIRAKPYLSHGLIGKSDISQQYFMVRIVGKSNFSNQLENIIKTLLKKLDITWISCNSLHVLL